MNKQQMVEKIERAWADLTDAIQGLSEEHMQQPGVTANWSVKDILAHISVWEEESLKHLPDILHGGRPTRYSVLYGGIDAFNAQMTEQFRALPMREVLRRLEDTHQRLLAYVGQSPEDAYATDTRFRRRLRWDTYSHYPIHAAAIREWRRQHGF